MSLRFIQAVVHISTSPIFMGTMFCCMDMPNFVYPLINWWTMRLFLSSAVRNNAALNTYAQVLHRHVFSILLCTYLVTEMLYQTATPCWTVWGTAELFSKLAAPFYIPIGNAWEFQLLHIIPNTCHHHLFYYSHPIGCQMASHWAFNLHFPKYHSCWASFQLLAAHLNIFFGEIPILIFCLWAWRESFYYGVVRLLYIYSKY